MMVPIRRQSSYRRTCNIHVVLLLVLLLSGVLASGSRVRSRKHRTSRGTTAAGRWQSRASSDGSSNTIHDLAAKPAPFSKPAHSATSGGPKKRSYYVPTVTNLENNLHHFINNLKTGIGSSKLAHAVNGVTGAIQQAVSIPGHGPINLLGSHRPVAGIHNAAGYYANANELRYGQPFSKQTASHFKTASYSKKSTQGTKRGRHSSTSSPPGKYDSLMSDLGISGYKHFENAVIRDLERREELKVEATIHTLFPDAGDDDWRPIASIKKTPLTAGVVRGTAPELSESKIVPSLVAVPTEKRPLETTVRTAKPKPTTVSGVSSAVRYGLTSTSVSPKSTTAPNQKHRSKAALLGKEKRTKERVKCWNCVTSPSTTVSTRQPSSVTYPTTAKLPAVSTQAQRFGPTYDATMFYGNNGKAPAAVAQSYSNVEIQYNRTHAPPFAVSTWPQIASGGPEEVSTQSAPPVTTYTALSDNAASSISGNSLASFYGAAGLKKSHTKAPKPYVPAGAYLGQGDATITSTTTHKPTGGSQGTKGTTKKRTNHHRPEGPSATTSHRRAVENHGDSIGAGTSKKELRAKKKFDAKYSRNRGTIKFKDALKKNPDQIYR
uniref:Uncharacterized protein n=1 Tax=Anopheles funestus TaxID=62324 RepID=A0A4Y0BHV0_ANOFN